MEREIKVEVTDKLHYAIVRKDDYNFVLLKRRFAKKKDGTRDWIETIDGYFPNLKVALNKLVRIKAEFIYLKEELEEVEKEVKLKIKNRYKEVDFEY